MVDVLGQLVNSVVAMALFLLGQLQEVVTYPIDPHQRIFVPYLFTSLLFALYVFITRRYSRSHNSKPFGTSLFRFLFPLSVWRDPSAWLDVRYFFFHQVFRLLIYGAYLGAIVGSVYMAVVATFSGVIDNGPLYSLPMKWPVEVLLVLLTLALSDLVAYSLHYAQHRVPILWEFHKVHHSATVMHPLTNYREHPIDNIVYAIGRGTTLGVMAAIAHVVLGYLPSEPEVWGVGVFLLLFNSLGYNLRHSHVWFRWPGRWGMVYGCPAHHQIHHSCHPEHIDKNFAFMFPIWDVLFGTYCLPQTNSDVKYGLGTDEERDYRSCLGLYVLPFRKAVARSRLFKRTRRA